MESAMPVIDPQKTLHLIPEVKLAIDAEIYNSAKEPLLSLHPAQVIVRGIRGLLEETTEGADFSSKGTITSPFFAFLAGCMLRSGFC